MNVGGRESAVAPATGEDSVGAGSVPPVVVKLKMFDQAALPLLEEGSIACTCQKYVPTARALGGV